MTYIPYSINLKDYIWKEKLIKIYDIIWYLESYGIGKI